MSSPTAGRRAYLVNIAWSWLGFVTLVLSSGIVMPMLIRRLGTAQFGVWSLAVSLVEYFWMIDLGFRPATVKLSAEFRALNQMENLNALVNTGIAYSVAAGGLVLCLIWFNAGSIASVLKIDHPAFGFLLRVVGLSWAMGLAFNVFSAVLEGLQRFDLSSRAAMLAPLVRGPLSLYVVIKGYGLREMGITLLVSQCICYAATLYYCWRVFPELRLSPTLLSFPMARRLIDYARQIISALLAQRLTQGAVPSLISHFKPKQYITYFTQTQRILDYAADVISRVAMVSAPRVTDWHARGEHSHIAEHARSANRYCLALWGLPATFLFVYGGRFCSLWVNQEFGERAGVLLPVFLVGYTCWMGQFVSAGALMGMARYTRYSFALAIEAIVVVAGVAIVLPRFGLAPAVAVISVGMIVTRCLVLAYLFCAELEIPWIPFLLSVYTRPMSLMILSGGILFVLRETVNPARTWMELLLIVTSFSIAYSLLAIAWIVEPDDRLLLRDKVKQQLSRRLGWQMEKKSAA